MQRVGFAVIGSLAMLALAAAPLAAAKLSSEDEPSFKERISLPKGWSFSVYTTGLGSPRLMQLASNGDILVSVHRSGIVARITADHDGDGKADGVTALARGLTVPHGLLLEDDKLYIAEENQITRYDFDGTMLSNPVRLAGGLPAGDGHSTRTLKRGPDGRLYLSVGSSCNVCVERSELRASIAAVGSDGELTVQARGLRNTVGFDWQPATGMLYGVDNGRDYVGDDLPPDELNLIVEGAHYGWPYRYGLNKADPDYGARMPDGLKPIPPVHQFGAHVAPLAIRFLQSTKDAGLKTAALVTKHGSWNRSKRVGYEIVALIWRDDGAIEEQPFMLGCLKNGKVFCRPVDVIEAPDGSLFVSDDFTGAIYHLTYQP